MRLTCHLRRFRGDESLRSLAARAGISAGQLAQIEMGRLLPRDDQVDQLERAYGQIPEDWYSPAGLRAIQDDEEKR